MAKKILIVDDEIDYAMLVKETLANEGYEVITAENGREGLEKFKNSNPDLAILDINMPVMTGFEMCEEIRKDKQYDEIPIIFLTVFNSKGSIVKGINCGIDEYITKPLRPRDLLIKVNKYFK